MTIPVLTPTLDALQVERLQRRADGAAARLRRQPGVTSAQVLVTGPLSRLGVYVWCQVDSPSRCPSASEHIDATLLPRLEEAIGLCFERREVRVSAPAGA